MFLIQAGTYKVVETRGLHSLVETEDLKFLASLYELRAYFTQHLRFRLQVPEEICAY